MTVSVHGTTAPRGPGPQHCQDFTITLTRTALGRIPLEEWSARLRDLYLTTHNTHKRQTSTPRLGFEPTIPASQRPQTQGLEAMGTGMGPVRQYNNKSQSDNRLTFAHKSLTQVLLTLVPLTQVITALCPHHFH
jgi:hypothetical protein